MTAKTIYITPEEYDIAAKNGIPAPRVYYRVNVQLWSNERAITEPVGKRLKDQENYQTYIRLKEQEENAVRYESFVNRLRKGMKPEDAIKKTTPKITKEIRELAAKNGIPKGTLEQRVFQYKKDPLTAATAPIETKFRRKGKVRNG